MNARFNFSDSIKLIKNIRTSGTITPSSDVLIDHLLTPIDFAKARTIVELGPGNGCVTSQLLKRMHKDANLICLEVNNEFVSRLNRFNDDRLHIHNDCASNLPSILLEQSIPCVDYVVSSLPLALINDETVESILHNVNEALCPEGRFLQYQYSLAHYGDLKALFSKVKLRFTVRNMPPAFVYECSKLR